VLHKEEERLCRQLGNLDSLSKSLGGQALILQRRGDLDGAMVLHKEEERLCRQLGNLDGLQISLGNQALILQRRGDLDGAMVLHKEKERLCRQLGDPEGLAISLANQGYLVARARGQTQAGLPLLEEALQLATLHGFRVLAQEIASRRQEVSEAAQATGSETAPDDAQPDK